jgi:hypothetical protein
MHSAIDSEKLIREQLIEAKKANKVLIFENESLKASGAKIKP